MSVVIETVFCQYIFITSCNRAVLKILERYDDRVLRRAITPKYKTK